METRRCVSCSDIFNITKCYFCDLYHHLYCSKCCEYVVYESFNGNIHTPNMYNEYTKKLNSKALDVFKVKAIDLNYIRLFLTASC